MMVFQKKNVKHTVETYPKYLMGYSVEPDGNPKFVYKKGHFESDLHRYMRNRL